MLAFIIGVILLGLAFALGVFVGGGGGFAFGLWVN